jgi:hypothetical protein
VILLQLLPQTGVAAAVHTSIPAYNCCMQPCPKIQKKLHCCCCYCRGICSFMSAHVQCCQNCLSTPTCTEFAAGDLSMLCSHHHEPWTLPSILLPPNTNSTNTPSCSPCKQLPPQKTLTIHPSHQISTPYPSITDCKPR